MKADEEILIKMEQLVDELLSNAKALREISSQVAPEEEIAALQKKQHTYIRELVTLEKAFREKHNISSEEAQLPISSRIRDKLQQFQKMNEAFIENVNANQGTIHFGKQKDLSQ